MNNIETQAIVKILENPNLLLLFFALTFWALIWKGFALWRAANNQQKKWFIVLLILNTFGILEIVYLFYFAKPKDKEPL